jgi:hypothetical protein
MGLGDDFKDLENDATGQGGNDGDNNANNASVAVWRLDIDF